MSSVAPLSLPEAFALIDATWPAAAVHQLGPFTLREGRGAGSRVSSASLEAPYTQADLEAVIAAHRALGQVPKFQIRPGLPGNDALDADLAARGYEVADATVIHTAPVETLAGEVPPVTAFAHWPPLAIARELWESEGIGAARQAVMARAAGPKACVLGRKQDRAAGAMFIGLSGERAMIHALVVLPEMRRLGLARAMIHEGARWAAEAGAREIALVVTRANVGANALYLSMGMVEAGGYHYRREANP